MGDRPERTKGMASRLFVKFETIKIIDFETEFRENWASGLETPCIRA
jgi:hypothetical protein